MLFDEFLSLDLAFQTLTDLPVLRVVVVRKVH